ncbi:NAAT family transporter [Methanoculleus sp. FWC-SCC1]|uniref:UPF0056 membrane protein n=1 Tax=Methanoculleus frigidifontis TaxID=2584085 RepID=A0ABT8MB10_9EURY|nr:MarC family protein [Methanoculleus sp. FWC-SCC1]MDN7025123.1 NAAT family transporter [Methanoculleus sp. FWC-SCC1]
MATISGTEGLLEFALVSFASLIAIINPASTTAVSTALLEGMHESERRKVIRQALKISLIVMVFFAFTGQLLFSFFSITVPAFRIAGGILLVSTATEMLKPRKETYSGEELENIAIVPLAFPLTCGAGTITTVILLASGSNGPLQLAVVVGAILLAIAISYAGMLYGPEIFRYIGREGLNVIPKLMAIIVLALAVQFIISGIAEALPQIVSNL